MIISCIVAIDENNGIAYKGQLPWYLPAELRIFKHTTKNHHLLMGRKTYESIGRPLPGRTTIVVTRQRNFLAIGCLVSNTVIGGIELAQTRGETELFVCGGRQIYAQTLAYTDRIYLTLVHTQAQVDTYFPNLVPEEWKEIDSQFFPKDKENIYAFTRKILVRKTTAEVDNP